MNVASKPSRTKQLAGLTVQFAATAGVIAAAAAAVVIGVSILNDRAAAVPDPADPIPVEVMSIVFQDGYTLPRRFTGQIEPRSSVPLSFELSGRLTALEFEEGDFVEAGQVIARLDTDLLLAEDARLKAERAAAAARLVFAQSTLSRAEQLQKQGFTSTETLDQARALRDELNNRIAQTEAALQAIAINVEKSVIYAPFSGQISVQSVEATQTIAAGQPILRLMETSAPELRVGLPLHVTSDALTYVVVDVAGREMPASLKRLRPDIDPATRTRTALFSLSADTDVLFGQTASIVLETPVSAHGAWVPSDALQSGGGSVWTVLIVEDATVRAAAVEVLHIDGARAFVRGTFDDQTQIVASGAHRVVSGQSVSVIGGAD